VTAMAHVLLAIRVLRYRSLSSPRTADRGQRYHMICSGRKIDPFVLRLLLKTNPRYSKYELEIFPIRYGGAVRDEIDRLCGP
jgi:hypothetical protein